MQYTTRKILTPEEQAEKDRQRADRATELRLKNNRLGITVFQWSWIMVFLCLIWMNSQMRFSSEWMAEGATRPSPMLPTIATLALCISTWLMHRAMTAIKSDQVPTFKQLWLLAIGLGGLFFGIMVTQFFAVVPPNGQFVAVYRLMIAYHALHALVIGFMMIQVYRYAQKGRYNAQNNWSVEATMRLWDFVTIAWLMFYVVLYII
jgi:heme/copper-type cytochrome/quinol oxidase subunit 3